MLAKYFDTKAIKDYDVNGTKQFFIHKDQVYTCYPAFGGYMVRFGTSEIHFPWASFGNYFVEPIKKDW